VAAAVVGGAMCGEADRALAYRPFDGTDAAVTDPGQAEVELQPVGRLQEGSKSFLVAPGIVINFGVIKGLEAVFEGRLLESLSSSEPPNLADAGTFLKYLVRPGVLQDKSGPSIATEFGVLYPETAVDSHFGAGWAGIISQRWDWGTVHVNVQTQLNREQRADLFVGIIIEGPHRWKVRPVAEFFYEDDVGSAQTISALVGLIWQVREDLSFDVAVREASLNGRAVNELRAGLTFAFPLDRFMRSARNRCGREQGNALTASYRSLSRLRGTG
jgi:hypothetical protein